MSPAESEPRAIFVPVIALSIILSVVTALSWISETVIAFAAISSATIISRPKCADVIALLAIFVPSIVAGAILSPVIVLFFSWGASIVPSRIFTFVTASVPSLEFVTASLESFCVEIDWSKTWTALRASSCASSFFLKVIFFVNLSI